MFGNTSAEYAEEYGTKSEFIECWYLSLSCFYTGYDCFFLCIMHVF